MEYASRERTNCDNSVQKLKTKAYRYDFSQCIGKETLAVARVG
jgi:hypothetical protein